MKDERNKILHIDDDEANRYAVRRILEKSGFFVEDAQDGNSGLEMIRSNSYDLVILDIKLPDLNGFEVCRRIKADSKTKSIPVLQTSASFVSSEHKVEGLESGADGYLAQPIDSAVLVATVRSLLRIRHAEKMALEAQRTRDELLAIVSHDLRNPLSSIMLMTKLLQKLIIGDRIGQTEILEKLTKIQSSGQRMNRLIQDLLDVSSMDEGKFNVSKSPFDAVSLIQDVMEGFEEKAAEGPIHLHAEIPPREIIVNGDKERLIQVLGNLITNSLKFTPVHGSVKVKVSPSDKHVHFSVVDSGKGIPRDQLKNIFNRYWQSPEDQASKQGVGLGLSIVKGIIDAHGGSIQVESIENKGTSFNFSIPL